MQFYNFHLMPWPDLPADFADKTKHESAWVTLSNKYYDPEKGHTVYNQYLDQLEYAEKLGFEGVCVNEHHQNTYGTMPAPNIMAAMLARRTSRMKIAMVGNGLPLRDHPLRVAEEVAMLDVVTGGRIISVLCAVSEMNIFPWVSIPPTRWRAFAKRTTWIIRSWTETGPFYFDGEHYQVRYVNVWPRPIQTPHPPIWIPGFGSKETVEWCAHPDRKYPYLAVFMPDDLVSGFSMPTAKPRTDLATKHHSYQMGHLLPVYVAETDSRAKKKPSSYPVALPLRPAP